MTLRFTKIDDLTRRDHWHLTPEDRCFFPGVYTARAGYAFSETNNFISNFKKSPERRRLPEWRYKGEAIGKVASMFRDALPEEWLRTVTLVPIPPSKVKDDPLYDDRMLRMLQALGRGLEVDIRELILQRESMAAAHESENRPSPQDLIENYYIDEAIAEPPPTAVALFDDLLTVGAHFKAAQAVIEPRYPDVPTAGIFIARRLPGPSMSRILSSEPEIVSRELAKKESSDADMEAHAD